MEARVGPAEALDLAYGSPWEPPTLWLVPIRPLQPEHQPGIGPSWKIVYALAENELRLDFGRKRFGPFFLKSFHGFGGKKSSLKALKLMELLNII